jgi:hypothetical protein
MAQLPAQPKEWGCNPASSMRAFVRTANALCSEARFKVRTWNAGV